MKDIESKEINLDLKLIAKSAMLVFVGLLISKILNYVFRIIIARHFGPEIYGIFSLAIMLVGLFIAVSSLGFIHGLLRFIPIYRGKKEKQKIKYLFSFLVVTLLISSLIFALALFFLAECIAIGIFGNAGLIIFLKVFSFLIPISIFSDVFLSMMRAYERIAAFSFTLNIFQNVAKTGLLILFVLFGMNSNAIILSYSLGIILTFFVVYLYSRVKLSEIFGKSYLDKNEKRKIRERFIPYSWPIMFVGLMTSILLWTDSFSIGYFLDATQVGFYNAAIPIAILLSFAPEIFMQLFFPLINKEYSKNNLETIKELSKQVAKWIFIINIPLFVVMFLFPGVIINLLFGEEYLFAVNTLRILAISGLITSFATLLENIISMKGCSKLLLSNVILAAVLNVFLNILLVPRYGIEGAAIATTAVWVLLVIALLIETKVLVSIIPLRRKMFNVILASIVPAIFIFYIRKFVAITPLGIVLIGVLFLLLYVLFLFLTKSLDKNDFLIIKTLKRKIGLFAKRGPKNT